MRCPIKEGGIIQKFCVIFRMMSHYTTLNEHTRTQDFFFSVTDSLAVVCHFSLNWIFFLLFEFLSLANYSGLVIFLFTFSSTSACRWFLQSITNLAQQHVCVCRYVSRVRVNPTLSIFFFKSRNFAPLAVMYVNMFSKTGITLRVSLLEGFFSNLNLLFSTIYYTARLIHQSCFHFSRSHVFDV